MSVMEFPCVDCGQVRKLDSAEVILRTRGVCGFCYVQRAIEDYKAWCDSMGTEPDAEAAEEYLHVTNYGSSLPEWIANRVRAA